MEKLTYQEEEAMRFIWNLGPCFVKDVVGCYAEPKPPYTTVASIINNLKRKGYLQAERFGNTYYSFGGSGRIYQQVCGQHCAQLLCQFL